MRIATWNINGLKARLEFVLDWLQQRQPDVVGLQELKSEDSQFPHELFSELGYTAHVHGQKAWNGVAVLCRQPAAVVRRGLPGQEDFGARLLTVQLDGLSFTTVYCPNGKTLEHADFGRKLAWFDALAELWAAEHPPEQAAVLCGDFNICPASLDTWRGAAGDESIFCTAAERARFDKLLGRGLTDLWRDRYPDTAAFSWWDYRGGSFHRGHGLRIDTLLGTEAVRQRVTDVVIDRDFRKKRGELTPSDHAPVYADLS